MYVQTKTMKSPILADFAYEASPEIVCHVTHFRVRFYCVIFGSIKFKAETVPGYKLNNHSM